MIGSIVFVYAMLTSFVLSGASLNHRLGRPNPPVLEHMGYVLCGVSAAVSAGLVGYALTLPSA